MILIRLQSLFGSSANVMLTIGALAPTRAGAASSREGGKVSGHFATRSPARLAQIDAEALIRDHGTAAYREARQRERDVILPDGTTHAGSTPAHWRRVALTRVYRAQ
jgi:hypothetical protein